MQPKLQLHDSPLYYVSFLIITMAHRAHPAALPMRWLCEGKGKGRRKNMLFGGVYTVYVYYLKDIRQGALQSCV